MNTEVQTAEIYSQPADEYHADSAAVSNSMLKVFADSRRKYHGRFVANTLTGPRTKAMDLGTVAHAAILEPHIIDTCCIEIPQGVLTSDGKKYGKKWDAWEADNAGKIHLKADELSQVRGMFNAVYANPVASRLLRAKGDAERCIRWTCRETGLVRRCRIDKIVGGWGFIDIKTTNSIKPNLFAKTCGDYGYAFQQAYYGDGYTEAFGGEVPHAAFIAVEPEPPNLVRVYEIDPLAVEMAGIRNLENLKHLKWCYESDDWSDDGEDAIQILNLPKWAYGGVD